MDGQGQLDQMFMDEIKTVGEICLARFVIAKVVDSFQYRSLIGTG